MTGRRSAAALLTRRPRIVRRARYALTRVPPLLGARSRELATMSTLATLAGDWPTAVEAARARLRRAPDDEGARVALMVGLWELGEEQQARDLAAAAVDGGAPSGMRAAARFENHLDDPWGAQRALDALPASGPALTLGIGSAWRRHGELDRAVDSAERILATHPGNRTALTLRRHARAEQRVRDGTWAPDAGPVALEPVPGRILHFLQRSLPHHRSGSTYRTHYSVTAQAAAGLEPHVVTQPGFATASADAEGTEMHGGVVHHRLASAPAAGIDERLTVYLEAASAVVEAVRPAVLHPASDYVNALVALELGRRYGLPVVYEVRGFPEVLQSRWSGSRSTLERSVWRREVEADCWRAADRIVTLAEVMKRRVVAHGVDPDRVVVVPNAVDSTAFEPREPDPALRARLGIPEGDLVVGYISTLSRYEGLQYLIDAVARLRSSGRRVHALIVGEGAERAHLRQLARRLGIAGHVTLPGRVDHASVLSYYALIDLFVVPRTAETTCQLVTPLKPYEAMAAGRAVVVSATAALREMVIDGKTGATFAPEDPADLARVIAALDDAPERRLALGRQAREWVSEHRSWRGNADRYLDLYRELGAA